MNEQDILDQLYDEGAIDRQLSNLKGGLTEIHELFKKIKSLEIQIKTSGSFKEATKGMREYSNAVSDMDKTEKNIQKTREETNKIMSQSGLILVEEQQAKRQATQEAKNLVIYQNAESGTREKIACSFIPLVLGGEHIR